MKLKSSLLFLLFLSGCSLARVDFKSENWFGDYYYGRTKTTKCSVICKAPESKGYELEGCACPRKTK